MRPSHPQSTGSLHFVHIRRTSLWAMIPTRDVEINSRLDPHLHEPHEGGRGVVRVKGREDYMAGEGRLDGRLRRLLVPRLTDEDDVGVLPQEGPDDAGEIQSDVMIHLDLGDAGKIVLRSGLQRSGYSTFGLFNSASALYKVVVFPDPVGPVT